MELIKRFRIEAAHQVDAAPDLPAVAADAEQLETVLVNVVRNAYEAVCEGRADGAGTIRVRLSSEQAPVLEASTLEQSVPGLRGYGEDRGVRVRIEIVDDGPGIPADVLRRIFHPFFTTKDRGSGLGVPTAQKILDAHAGSLDVESKPGEGAHFIVRLPAETLEEEDFGQHPRS